MITVKYFASLQDTVGKAEDKLDASANLSIEAIWQTLHNTPLPKGMLVSLNQEYAALTDPVTDGDEVAYFPPVTGG